MLKKTFQISSSRFKLELTTILGSYAVSKLATPKCPLFFIGWPNALFYAIVISNRLQIGLRINCNMAISDGDDYVASDEDSEPEMRHYRPSNSENSLLGMFGWQREIAALQSRVRGSK